MALDTPSSQFGALCEQAGIAPTHQRLVIWQALKEMRNHPSPEEVFARVRPQLPTVSLATVYNSINLFLETGVFRQVNAHHRKLRIETNATPHPHLVCRQCRTISDLDAGLFDNLPAPRDLPDGFVAEHVAVDVIGLCSSCREGSSFRESPA